MIPCLWRNIRAGGATKHPGLHTGRISCREGGGKGVLSSVAACFLGQGQASELGRLWAGAQPCVPSPGLGHLCAISRRRAPRASRWERGCEVHLQPLTALSSNPACPTQRPGVSYYQDLPESSVLTCKVGGVCLLGFHKDSVNNARCTEPVHI